MRYLRVVPLALVVCIPDAGVAAQRTLVVPTQHPDVPAAVAAANAGDTILVRPGSYDEIGTIAKGITILCDPGVLFTRPFIGGSFVVAGVPRGQSFVWRGGQVLKTNVHQWEPFEFRNCAGSVVVEGLVTGGAGFGCGVQQCANVQLHATVLPQLTAIGSNLGAAECVAEQCYFVDSRVALARSTIGSGSSFVLFAGIRSTNSHLTIGAGTVVEGRPSATRPAIEAAGGSLRIDPLAQLISGTAPIRGTATVTYASVPTTTAAVLGQTFVAEVLAVRGSTTVTFASQPVAPVPLPFGELWVSPTSPVLDVGTVPASGLRRVAFALPPIARGGAVILQPGSLLPASNALVLGAPTAVVLD